MCGTEPQAGEDLPEVLQRRQGGPRTLRYLSLLKSLALLGLEVLVLVVVAELQVQAAAEVQPVQVVAVVQPEKDN